jgi:hypothetical protein
MDRPVWCCFRCHEFVDTTVTETRGDGVLDLRVTRGSRGSVQRHTLLDMETPVGAILSSTYTGTVRLESVTLLESALGSVNMFANISNELSGSADIAGKAVVEKHSPVCVQVQSDAPQSSRYSAGREDGVWPWRLPCGAGCLTQVCSTQVFFNARDRRVGVLLGGCLLAGFAITCLVISQFVFIYCLAYTKLRLRL